ncbi:MAG: efflux RND transporter periplasmic adaptor subunit, partial [Pirellulales bacterium]
HHEEHHQILVTSPVAKDVISTQQYVCQIHSCQHIEVCTLERGYLEEIHVKEGQAVTHGDQMFKIVPVLYQAKRDTEEAEVQLAEIEYSNTQQLFRDNVVSDKEVALSKARLAKAQAQLKLAEAELMFTDIKAHFDGIIDRLMQQKGSLIEEGGILTTLSDNSVMWVYFNVPEARYLEYKEGLEHENEELRIELVLANGKKFPQPGTIGAIEAEFNNETGNIAFRADFPNPGGLLRHGQTGTVVISRVEKNALVIPQRATFEILAKKYAYVVEEPDANHSVEHGSEDSGEHADEQAAVLHGQLAADHEQAHGTEHNDEHNDEHSVEHAEEYGIVRQREIVILNEMDDIYVIKDGLNVDDKIILEGILQVRDGEEVDYEYIAPETVLGDLKYKAE